MRKRLSVTTFALTALFAGCGDTANPATPVPSDPAFDGGWTIGSGGRSDTTTAPPSTQATAGGALCVSSEDGGGWTIGSGGGAVQGADQCEAR
jgi:hypothetical protein